MCSNKTWSNKFISAAAGSGKTTFLIEKAIKIDKDEKVLITTYTESNCAEIQKRMLEKNKCIPKNVYIQTWFSMLLQHGVRPYQSYLFDKQITGMNLVPGQSPTFISKQDIEKFYFDSNRRIYSDKIVPFILKCNEVSSGKVISRLSKIFKYIFIDESQDIAGSDLEFVDLLCNSGIYVILVGDPRQGTFSTNNSNKHKKYRRSNILQYFENKSTSGIIICKMMAKTGH